MIRIPINGSEFDRKDSQWAIHTNMSRTVAAKQKKRPGIAADAAMVGLVAGEEGTETMEKAGSHFQFNGWSR
jgi:hypothetical protein